MSRRESDDFIKSLLINLIGLKVANAGVTVVVVVVVLRAC